MTTIKIKLPEKLSEGLTPVKFKAWKGQLTVFLKQSRDYTRFLPGGIYANWLANEETENRIATLHATDTPAEAAAERLQDRQTQLETFLSIIAGLCDASQYEDVMQRSTSVEWIWQLIETDYDIQKKGRHFLKLDALTYDKAGTETHTAFYKRLRSHFIDNLRKTGEKVKSRNDERLTEDEKISPTLENTIVYMALRDIDPRLPSHVEQVYGHRMDRDTTLYDLQPEIFQAMPKLLSDLEAKDPSFGAVQPENFNYNQQQDYDEDPMCAAAGYQRGNSAPRRFNPRQRGNGRQRSQQRGQLGRFYQPARPVPRVTFNLSPTGKMCNLCRDAGYPMRVCQSHTMRECNRWDRSTISQIRSMVLEDKVDPLEYPEPEAEDYEDEEEA